MTATRPFIPTYEPYPFTDDDGLRRYHVSGGDYIVIKNLKAGNLFAISNSVWQSLGEDMKNIPAEWRSYKNVVVVG